MKGFFYLKSASGNVVTRPSEPRESNAIHYSQIAYLVPMYGGGEGASACWEGNLDSGTFRRLVIEQKAHSHFHGLKFRYLSSL